MARVDTISLRTRLESRWGDGGRAFNPDVLPLVFGHRGGAAIALENTLPAFESARIDRVEAVELDVQMSCDGELLVFHDRDLQRLGGVDTELTSITATEAGSIRLYDGSRGFSANGIPRLSEVIETLPSSVYIDIEIKSYPSSPITIPEVVAAAIARYGIAERVLVSSFDPRQIRRFRAAKTEYASLLSGVLDAAIYSRSRDVPWILRRGLGRLIGGGTIRKPAFNDLRKNGRVPRLTIPWTVNSPEIARRLGTQGVAGIISDNPTTVRDSLSSTPNQRDGRNE